MGGARQTVNIHCKTKSFGKKAMPCVWWDQKGYYELLKPGETINATNSK